MNKWTWVGCAIFGLLLGGCKVIPATRDPGGTYGATSEVPDVPVPQSFRLKRTKGHYYAGSFRSAELHYWGFAEVDSVAAWYLKQMPRKRWELVRDFGMEERSLSYEKGIEDCSVSIFEDMGVTRVVVRIEPKES